MNYFERQLFSFPSTSAQKFILDPYIDDLYLYINTFDVNSTCTYNRITVLMFMCKYSHSFDPLRYSYYVPYAIEKIKWLLTVGGADPNKQNEDGWTALMYAVLYSSSRGLSKRQCIDGTLKEYKIDPIKQKINKKISFMIASYLQKKENYIGPKSSEAVVKILLANGADPNKQSKVGWTALMLAARNSSPERGWSSEKTVEILLATGADPNKQDKDGWTALIFAAGNSSPIRGWSSERTVEILLAAGADPNKQSEYGYTALMHAAHDSYPERGWSSERTVEILLAKGADPKITN